MTKPDLERLVARFRDGTLPKSEWTHAAHLAVGAWHVHALGAPAALAYLRVAIRALNDRHGTANTPTSGYHETVTAAYVRLLATALAEQDAAAAIEARVRDLLAGPLAQRDALLRYWSRDVLMSPAARAAWVPPDLASLGPLSV